MRELVVAFALLCSRVVGDETPNPAACVEAHGEVVYGALGYDHYVSLKNSCDRAFSCTVRTDVNPQPIDVVVPPMQTVSILTFRGSPARVFTPYVTCSVTNLP
jgi:hypothetical protein